MSILDDMDSVFLEHRPIPPGCAWLVGGNCWHAVMADITRRWRENGMDLRHEFPPETLFGLKLIRVQRMSGWGLAEALDLEPDQDQEPPPGELTPNAAHGD